MPGELGLWPGIAVHSSDSPGRGAPLPPLSPESTFTSNSLIPGMRPREREKPLTLPRSPRSKPKKPPWGTDLGFHLPPHSAGVAVRLVPLTCTVPWQGLEFLAEFRSTTSVRCMSDRRDPDLL